MKRYLMMVAALCLALCSCQEKEDFSGSVKDVDYATANYLMCIADDFTVDNLREVERLLALDEAGSLWEPGHSSRFNRDNSVFGATLTKAQADSTWTIDFDGDFSFDGNTYPTKCRLTLRMLPDKADGQSSDPSEGEGFGGGADQAGTIGRYHDWKVTLEEGVRTERGGYSASFRSYPNLVYYSSGAAFAWHECHGAVLMDVLKNGKVIDTVILILKGTKSEYETRRLS